MNQCFIVSPIGEAGSGIRVHADDVMEHIIRPAARALDLEAVRSEQISKEGRITQQMFDAVLGSELVIAVLTGNNPNVFYEVALAQCARRPLVLLVREGDGLPFDMRDLRVIPYDGSFHAGKLPATIDQIVERAKLLLEDAEQVPMPSALFGFWPAPEDRLLGPGRPFVECIDEIRKELRADGIFSIWSKADDPSIPDLKYLRDIALQKLLFASTRLWEGRAWSANLWICHDLDAQGRPRNLRSGMRNGDFPFHQLLDKVTLTRKVYYRAVVVDYEREDLSVAAQVVRRRKPVIEWVKDSKFEDAPEEDLGIQWILGIPICSADAPVVPGQPVCITVDYLDPIEEGAYEKVRGRAATISELFQELLAAHGDDPAAQGWSW
jgi:hypothetical protein